MEYESRYPGAREGVFRVSQSSVETYLRCGLRYFYDRESPRRQTTVRMAIGTAVAVGARLDAWSKINRGEPATLRAIVDSSVDAYDCEVEECEVEDARAVLSRGRDDVAEAASAFGREISPRIEPSTVVAAEVPVVAVIDDGIELAGTADLVTTKAVRDLKTGRRWTQRDADRTRQLTAYSILEEARAGVAPNRVAIDTVFRLRGRWSAATVWSVRDESDRVAFVEAVRAMRAGVEAGVALPAPTAGWYCSRAWCPHWNRCALKPRDGKEDRDDE